VQTQGVVRTAGGQTHGSHQAAGAAGGKAKVECHDRSSEHIHMLICSAQSLHNNQRTVSTLIISPCTPQGRCHQSGGLQARKVE
jgi:hypothetical protein